MDDTVSSFCNIDVLPAADAIITSLTKSFSGYADVMAGSVVLNPNTSSYSALKPLLAENYHNEFFGLDADHLFKNSDDYLVRSQILNGNAEALAAYFQTLAEDPKSPVAKVCYPPYAPGSENLLPFFRKSTPEFPKIGYGCLLSVEFDTIDELIVFYDNLDFHDGPHLGAHLTLVLPYNAMIYGKENPDYHEAYGMSPKQLRISVGLEQEAYLIGVCQKAMDAVSKSGVQAKEGGELAGKIEQKVEESEEVKVGTLSGSV